MFKCAIYTNQNNLVGTEKQRFECEKLIAEREWILIDKKYDDLCGNSVPALRRPAMQKLLLDIEAGEVDYVFAYTINCLATSTSDLEKLEILFDENDVRFEDAWPEVNWMVGEYR